MCQLSLDCYCVVGKASLSVGGVAYQLGKPAQISGICLTHIACAIGVLDIIVAVAHAECALRKIHGIVVGTHHVGFHTGLEESAHARCGGKHVDYVGTTGLVYGHHIAHHRLRTLYVEAQRVKAHGIQVADFLRHRAWSCITAVEAGDEFAHLYTVIVAQLVECAEARELRFKRVEFHPSSAGIVVEVGLRSHAFVEIGTVDSARCGYGIGGHNGSGGSKCESEPDGPVG